MSLDLGNLSAAFEQNRTAVLGTAAAGVVGLALYRKHKSAGSSASGAAATPATSSVSAGGQVAGMYGANSYDSSSSDVYGLVQPQLESLGNQLSDLATKVGQVPVSAPPASPTPAYVAPAPAPAPVYAPPPPPPVPVAAAPTHAVDQWVVVHPGDNLSKIAARYPQVDITWQSIARDNGIKNPSLIHPNDRLHIVG